MWKTGQQLYLIGFFSWGPKSNLEKFINLPLLVSRANHLMSLVRDVLRRRQNLVFPVAEDMNKTNKHLANPHFCEDFDVVEIFVLKKKKSE